MESIRILAVLFLVVVLVAGILWAMRSRRVGGGSFSLLHYYPLGPKRGVAAVKVYNEVLVLGITSHNVQLLRSFPASEIPEVGDTGKKGYQKNFGAILGGLK